MLNGSRFTSSSKGFGLRGFLISLVVFALFLVVAPRAMAEDGCACCTTKAGTCCQSHESDGFSPVFAPLHLPGGQGCACDREPVRPEPSARPAFTRVQLPDQLLAAPVVSALAVYPLSGASSAPAPGFCPPPLLASHLLKCSFVC